ncbi:hypothetical protein KI387_005635, partial [Taxus chinensis]
MGGSLLTIRLRRISPSDTTVSYAFGFDLVRSISSLKFVRWEQFRYMGSPAKALNKWQQKRLDEKKDIQKQKRGQFLDNTTHNSYKSSKNSAKQGPRDQITALADKFMKVGAVDLWNENDGPLTTDPPSADTSKVRDSTNEGKIQRKDTVKGSLEKDGSVVFSRSFSSRRTFNGVGILTEAEELDAGDTLKDTLGASGSVFVRKGFSRVRSRGFNMVGIFREGGEPDSGGYTTKDSLGKSGSILFRRYFSSVRSRRFNRVGTFRKDEELDDEWYGDRPFDSVGNFSDEEDGVVSTSNSKSKSNWRKGREFERLDNSSDEEEMGQKVSRSSSVPKSLIEDEMELGNIIDEEMTAGMKFEEELLNGKRSGQFYGNDEEALRRSRFLSVVDSMENFPGRRSREKSSDEEDDWRDSRNPKTGRVGGFIRSKRQSMSGFGEELSNSNRNYSRGHYDNDEKAFRRPKSSRMEEFREVYSGHRTRERSFDENEGRRVSRNPKTGRVGGSMPSHRDSSSKRQSMGSFDKAEEMGFRPFGSNRRGRSFSSFSGSNRQLAREIDLEKETESGQLKSSRMGDFISPYSVRQSRRESLREKTEDRDKERGFRQTKAEHNWLKFGTRLKSETSIDMEMSEDEEEDLDIHSLPGEFYKKEQRHSGVLHTKNPWSWNVNEEESCLSSSRFDEFNISPLTIQALSSTGYAQMTVVQKATLPVILEGKDVLVKAKRGTGKTLAFLLPAIEVVVRLPPPSQDQKRPIVVLIICPTRELAIQTSAEANALLKHHFNIGVQLVTEGTRLYEEKIQLDVNLCQIIVATPRRLLDHIDNVPEFSNRLMGLKLLILDEADRLLKMGFHEDLHKIIDAVPRHRQSLLFSATIQQEVQQISQIALKRDHAVINTVGLACPKTHAKVVQRCIVYSHEGHFNLLYGVLMEHISRESDYKVLVFCTTPAVATIFYEVLLGVNMNVREITSRKSEVYGSHRYNELQRAKGLILVTSDASAHGVDYRDVTFIVQ